MARSFIVDIPVTPNTMSQTMRGSAVLGLALNGLPIYGNFASPGDDIYTETRTIDLSGAHPQNTGSYHYQ